MLRSPPPILPYYFGSQCQRREGRREASLTQVPMVDTVVNEYNIDMFQLLKASC